MRVSANFFQALFQLHKESGGYPLSRGCDPRGKGKGKSAELTEERCWGCRRTNDDTRFDA